MRNSNTTLKQTNKQTNKQRKKAHCFFDQIEMNAEASLTSSLAIPA